MVCRLTIKGCVQAAKNAAGEVTEKFDWAEAIADAAIIASLGFFTSTFSSLIAHVSIAEMFAIGGISAGIQFFGLLALKRNIKKVDIE